MKALRTHEITQVSGGISPAIAGSIAGGAAGIGVGLVAGLLLSSYYYAKTNITSLITSQNMTPDIAPLNTPAMTAQESAVATDLLDFFKDLQSTGIDGFEDLYRI